MVRITATEHLFKRALKHERRLGPGCEVREITYGCGCRINVFQLAAKLVRCPEHAEDA